MIKINQFASMNMLYSHFSFKQFLDDTERIGYKNIELWGATPHYTYYETDQRGQCDRIKKEVKSHNLKIICFTPEQCIYPFNIASSDKLIRDNSIEYFSRCIEDTALLDCDTMMITPGWGNLDEDRDEAWKYSIESTQALLKKAEKEGIRLVYEILLPTESNLVTDLESLKDMMKNFDSGHLACCVDTVPMSYARESLDDYFTEFNDSISHIHLNDGTPTGHMAWGDGHQNLKAHLDALDNNNYQGYITFETGDDKYIMEPSKAFEKNYQAIIDLL